MAVSELGEQVLLAINLSLEIEWRLSKKLYSCICLFYYNKLLMQEVKKLSFSKNL